MDGDTLFRLNRLRAERRAVVTLTRLADANARLVVEGEDFSADPLASDIARALQSGQSKLVETAEGEVFLAAEIPPPRIIAIGAVHISQAMVTMARAIGFDLTVIDPRTAFATPERFAGVTLHADWPETVLPGLKLDAYTAVAALTHDPKIDDVALVAALQAGCFYVGALGSRKTHARRGERLMEKGVSAEAFARIRAPIGLDIGAASPAEIAVAVTGEIIAAFRKRAVGPAS